MMRYNKQFEMVAVSPLFKPTTLPACTRTLIRKGVECAKKEKDEKKPVKSDKVKLPKQAAALKF
jgi:hypothetical protein